MKDTKSHIHLVHKAEDSGCLTSLNGLTEEVTDGDTDVFFRIISEELTPEQVKHILTPTKTYPFMKAVLATHWHPEFVPLNLIAQRIDSVFPNREDELIIPTQHNELMRFGQYAGVEVDCYSRGFNQKVQLLLHFHADRLEQQSFSVLNSMLDHTFKYRSSQLFDFIHTITKPVDDRLTKAARETGADEQLVTFVRTVVKKIEKMLATHHDVIPQDAFKNKLLRNFFDSLRPHYGNTFINRAQAFLTAVKQIVKVHFPLTYFYRTSEVIEEARGLGGCIVVPHPEQFWPILLADYDVDGYEIWNPQSQRYTEFLIDVVSRKNAERSALHSSNRRLLVFMGDDTHMGEKVRESTFTDLSKAEREIGVQQAWDDLTISKRLILAKMDKATVIDEYKTRLNG